MIIEQENDRRQYREKHDVHRVCQNDGRPNKIEPWCVWSIALKDDPRYWPAVEASVGISEVSVVECCEKGGDYTSRKS